MALVDLMAQVAEGKTAGTPVLASPYVTAAQHGSEARSLGLSSLRAIRLLGDFCHSGSLPIDRQDTSVYLAMDLHFAEKEFKLEHYVRFG